MDFQYFLSIDALIMAIIAVMFGCGVLLKNIRSRVHWALFLLNLATAFWLFGYWRWLSIYSDANQALFWTRILSLGSTFIPVFYFQWISSLLNVEKKNRWLLVIAYGLAIFFSFFSFSPLFVSRVEPIRYFSFWPKAGWLYSIYLILVYFGLVIYSIILQVKKLRMSSGVQKTQIKYVLYGSIFGFGGGATNFFLWYNVNILPLGNSLVIFYVIIFSYAMIKHRLMDIKLILRKSTVLIFSLLTIFIPAALLMELLAQYSSRFSIWPNFFILMVGVLIYTPVRNYYYRLANKYFFTSLYDSAHVISEVSNGLKMILDTDKVYDFIHSVMEEVFHVQSFGVLALDSKKKNYLVRYNAGFDTGGKIKFSGNELLSEYFTHQNKIIVVEEARNEFYNQETKATLDLLTKLKIEIIIPLSIKNKIIGILVLGPKETGDVYNDDDLQVLEVIGAQLGVALNNAQLYTQVKNFNVKLKKEVESATKELRTTNDRLQTMADRLAQANDKLRKLDNAKNEFISIASHQLRTPLTAIKGFISLLLEGSYGEVPDQINDVLNKVYLSNERLINLVEDLLNVSRIESGRMEYKFEKVQLADLIREIYDTFTIRARDAHLKFELNLPENPPEVTTDRSKIREVISNLVDNALKYTPKGWVRVTLTDAGEFVRVAVSDTGIGVPKDEVPYLFQKFSRGKDVSRLNTGGTGLGLHVGKKMMEALHGQIGVESKGANLGSTFFIEVPKEVGEK